MLSWTGSMDLFGWRALAAGLDKPLRGPIAYVLGFRMLRIKQPADAVRMFETARDDAPPGSALRRLAQAELDRLGAK